MEIKLLQSFNNLFLDLVITAYCKAFQDMGKTETEGLKEFTSRYVQKEITDPGEVVEIWIRLKKMLNKLPDA